MKYIYNDLGVNFHLDDDFNEIVNYETGKLTFSKADAVLLNSLVGQCFSVCERENVDFYEIACEYHPLLQDN